MKNNEQFREAVFEKAEIYKKTKEKQKKQRAYKALAIAVCTLIAVPAVYISTSFLPGNHATAAGTATSDSKKPPLLSSDTEQTEGAPGVQTTGTTAVATSVQYSTVHTLPPNEFVPDISAGDRIFANGAFAYKTEYEEWEKPAYGSVIRINAEYYYRSLEGGELCKYAEPYIYGNSGFLDHQALAIVKITVERGIPVLDRIYTGEGIEISLRLIIEEGAEYEPSTWIVLVPISKKIAVENPERVYAFAKEYHVD